MSNEIKSKLSLKELYKRTGIRKRVFIKENYHSIFNGIETLRFKIEPNKDITESEFPEFWDIKVTNKCNGNCSYCYQDSVMEDKNYDNILEKFDNFFNKMNFNQKPYQIAFGGGEITLHPQFSNLMKLCKESDILPNYTTNGINITKEILETTKKYCGGVAVSTHNYLDWKKGVKQFLDYDILTNLHMIISDKKSVDDFLKIYEQYKETIYYFVMLPYTKVGRADNDKIKNSELEDSFNYFFEKIRNMVNDKHFKKIAYGANFYPYLLNPKNKPLKLRLYEPEQFSKYLDFKDMKIYPSSFEKESIDILNHLKK